MGMVRGVTFESQWAHLNESAWWYVNINIRWIFQFEPCVFDVQQSSHSVQSYPLTPDMLIMSMDGLLLPMDGHSMLVMSATLDSRVSLVLFYLQAAQSISAIQNVSRVLVFISLQNLSRLLVFICHVFSWTICPTRSSYAKYPVQWMEQIPTSWSRLCRFAVASLRFVRSNGLFQHHTSHKRRHQGSR